MDEHELALYVRLLDGGRYVAVYRFMLNDRLVWGPDDGTGNYDRGFCYQQDGSAIEAAQAWDGEGDPPGPWIKEVGTSPKRYGPGMETIR